MKTVFVEGASGTVGLALQPHLNLLEAEGLIQVIRLGSTAGHSVSARLEAFAASDLVLLCLPDQVALATVELIKNVNPRCQILDASAAHRCQPGWVYGLPELGHQASIKGAQYVANPGCFATACILAARPVREVCGGELTMAFHGVTGRSAGGKKMVDAEVGSFPMLTQFGKRHRHLPEIAKYGGVTPSLSTLVGPWLQGMLVQTEVVGSRGMLKEVFADFYTGTETSIEFAEDLSYRVDPQSCNGSNKVKIVLAAGADENHTSVAVVLDNLGKGSAGAAAQNLRLMLA